ncbi:hypothetical protein D0Z08_25885 [Nocardioides immobilis]|uniref:Calcium-binding protein n=1 Tax=Nocardioides immobilis TaxID=2049295 RepID=A0A417XUW4_9ACTN|nr:hypothetical protein [Nocardioides immobilis]RHW24153.1 hypothetical protein D0Z08_25885 [Nocardioides immobilis]
MRRSRQAFCLSAVALAVAGVGLSGSAEVVAVGAEFCHGHEATIVGTPGADIDGTDGPDVIVTNGAFVTDAGDGDDLICVTGGTRKEDADVYADAGDDVIDTSASGAGSARVDLGTGDDTYLGGPGPDRVFAADSELSPRGQGSDTVTTAGGDDWVVTGGVPGDRDHDAIDLGSGDDEVGLEGPGDPALPIQGGSGSDEIEFGRSTMRRAWAIDNAAGQATYAGEPVLTWSGMESFELTPWGGWVAPSFVGGDGPEKVFSVVPLTSVDLGGGDDRIAFHLHTKRLVDHATYDGGAGTDSFILNAGAGDQARRVDLDLVGGSLLFRPADEAVRARIGEFERYRLSAWRLDVAGTAAPEHVLWIGCRGVVAGGPGDDILEAIAPADVECGYLGDDAEAVARGGPGDDTLVGEYMPDILIGGPGTDYANGRRNHDRCVAETVVRC